MPIIDVEIVNDPSEAEIEVPLQVLADAIGGALGSEPGRTWVRLRTLATSHYAENQASDSPRPVFVRMLKANAGTIEERRQEARLLAGTIAGIVKRPVENVHILYEPDARGRIAFGGKLLD